MSTNTELSYVQISQSRKMTGAGIGYMTRTDLGRPTGSYHNIQYKILSIGLHHNIQNKILSMYWYCNIYWKEWPISSQHNAQQEIDLLVHTTTKRLPQVCTAPYTIKL